MDRAAHMYLTAGIGHLTMAIDSLSQAGHCFHNGQFHRAETLCVRIGAILAKQRDICRAMENQHLSPDNWGI